MQVLRFLKMQLAHLVKVALFYSGFFSILRRVKPNRHIAILRYHAVVDRTDNDYTSPSIAISPRQFERHVRYFSRNYKIISLDEALHLLQENKPAPVNAVVFTFDDGYADNYLAYKILKKFDAGGTIYLTAHAVDRRENFWLAEITFLILRTEKKEFSIVLNDEKQTHHIKNIVQRWRAVRAMVRLIKSNNLATRELVREQLQQQLANDLFQQKMQNLMLDWQQVKEMQANGMIFGAHTLTHLNLPNADYEDALQEIAESKVFIEEKTGVVVQHFSYPNSGPYKYFTPEVRNMVENSGYASAVTSAAGFACNGDDLFALKRVRTVPSLVETVAGIELSKCPVIFRNSMKDLCS